MGRVGRAGTLALSLLVVAACYVAEPAASRSPGAAVTASATRSPDPTATLPAEPSQVIEPADPAVALAGRAVKALGTDGVGAIMRIGAEGFRLPDGERVYDVHDDRVLAARPGSDGAEAWLVVRTLEGDLVREIATGMQVPQTGIVRGDDVYFGGIDLGEDGTDVELATDRGVWVVHGDAAPERLLDAQGGPAVYSAIERSPDGRTVGIWRCGETCSTILIRADGDIVEVPKPGLIALTNEVALLIGNYSDLTAHAIDDGAELWRAETEGIYYGRYATTDGDGFVLSSIEDGPGDGSTDQLRIELLDAQTGAVDRTVLVSTEETLLWVERSLSTDRFVALLGAVVPNPDDGPRWVRVVDLDAGRLLDVELMLGSMP